MCANVAYEQTLETQMGLPERRHCFHTDVHLALTCVRNVWEEFQIHKCLQRKSYIIVLRVLYPLFSHCDVLHTYSNALHTYSNASHTCSVVSSPGNSLWCSSQRSSAQYVFPYTMNQCGWRANAMHFITWKFLKQPTQSRHKLLNHHIVLTLPLPRCSGTRPCLWQPLISSGSL